MVGIAGDAMVKNRTFVYATAANAQIELVPAGAEKDIVQNNTADLVRRCAACLAWDVPPFLTQITDCGCLHECSGHCTLCQALGHPMCIP